MSFHCDCKDWEPEIKKLNGPITLQSVRSGGAYKYDGKPFNFCPWCGKRLALQIAGVKIEVRPEPRPETNRCRVCGTPTFGLYCAKHSKGGIA